MDKESGLGILATTNNGLVGKLVTEHLLKIEREIIGIDTVHFLWNLNDRKLGHQNRPSRLEIADIRGIQRYSRRRYAPSRNHISSGGTIKR